MAKPKYRHCTEQECDFYKQGKQVPCRLYELDLLHGRKKLTPLEVKAGQTKPREECRYQLPPLAQTSAKCTNTKIQTTHPIKKIPYVPNAVRDMPFTIHPVKR